jgi:ABC-type Fe3+ transport system substrate-binding protein
LAQVFAERPAVGAQLWTSREAIRGGELQGLSTILGRPGGPSPRNRQARRQGHHAESDSRGAAQGEPAVRARQGVKLAQVFAERPAVGARLWPSREAIRGGELQGLSSILGRPGGPPLRIRPRSDTNDRMRTIFGVAGAESSTPWSTTGRPCHEGSRSARQPLGRRLRGVEDSAPATLIFSGAISAPATRNFSGEPTSRFIGIARQLMRDRGHRARQFVGADLLVCLRPWADQEVRPPESTRRCAPTGGHLPNCSGAPTSRYIGIARQLMRNCGQRARQFVGADLLVCLQSWADLEVRPHESTRQSAPTDGRLPLINVQSMRRGKLCPGRPELSRRHHGAFSYSAGYGTSETHPRPHRYPKAQACVPGCQDGGDSGPAPVTLRSSRTTGRSLIRLIGIIACLIPLVSGCSQPADDVLVVATNWTDRECRAVETEFSRWSRLPAESMDVPTQIRWVLLEAGDDPARVGDRLSGVDVILGGSPSYYSRLADAQGLGHPDVAGGPLWIEARRSPIGWAFDPRSLGRATARLSDSWTRPLPPGRVGRMALGDPRNDPTARALALSLLESSWSEGYAALIHLAAQASRIDSGGRSAISAVERGRASLTPAIAEDLASHSDLEWSRSSETLLRLDGAAMLRSARNHDRAAAFLRFLTSRGGRSQPPPPRPIMAPAAESLLVDLLGASMVESQAELWVAWAALERAKWPKKLVEDLQRAPPWPPASIEKMKAKEGSDVLLDTLAEQIAVDPYDHAWLLELWDRPATRVNGEILAELATVNSGRLGTNPRLRAWLRGEWTAWARQNARRVAREAEKVKS